MQLLLLHLFAHGLSRPAMSGSVAVAGAGGHEKELARRQVTTRAWTMSEFSEVSLE